MIRRVLGWLAAVSLLACLAVPLLYFLGHIGTVVFEGALAAASVGWFVTATAWSTRT